MDRPMENVGFGSSATTDTGSSRAVPATTSGTCPHCGQSLNRGNGLEQFLGKIGISDEMIANLRNSMQNVDIDEYLDTAREYLRTSGEKAKSFTKENPGKVAAGVAVLAVGAGLLISALNRE